MFGHRSTLQRLSITATVTVALVVALAVPALASWSRQVTYGTPGAVFSLDSPGAQGGICHDPFEAQSAYDACTSATDQIYLDRYRAYTTAVTARQTIKSTVYLYGWTGSWQYLASSDEGACPNQAGGANGYCTFGSRSPELNPACTHAGPSLCVPAFIGITPGYYYTVVVSVTWYNTATGRALAQANFTPTGSASDIGCASFAVGQGRCAPGGTSVGYLYLG